MENKNLKQNQENKNNSLSRPSFYEILDAVKVNTEIETFGINDSEFAEEIARIITEVLTLDSRGTSYVGGETISTLCLQELFLTLTHDHIQYVIRKYRQITYPIKKKKSYLRTALYNSLFEMESDMENEIKVTFK